VAHIDKLDELNLISRAFQQFCAEGVGEKCGKTFADESVAKQRSKSF